MTTDEIADYYAKLLIIQYKNKPRATYLMKSFVTPLIMDQLPTQIRDAFDVNTAVGVQLDVVGKYAGVTRFVQDFSGPITLSDDDFRLYIQMAIIQNNTGSSLADIDDLFQEFFPGAFKIYDYTNMRMSYVMNPAAIGSTLAQVFVTQKRFPKPMAVQLADLIDDQYNGNIFGFIDSGNYPPANSVGFGDSGAYDGTTHWINDGDAFV